MSKAKPAIFAGAIMVGLVAFMPAAPAEIIPVPVPAPLPKTTGVAPPPSATIRNAPLALAPGAPLPNPVIPSSPTKPSNGIVAGLGGVIVFDAKQRGLVDRVNAYLTSVQTLVGDFVQVGPGGGRTEGKFYLQKPGRVRFEYDPPNPVELIADGQSVAIRDRKLATQDILPLSQTPLRFLVADRVDLLRDTNLVGVSADDVFVTIVIEEKQVLGGTHRIMLLFGAKDFQLRQWTVTDPQGYDTTVALYNLDSTQKLDPAMFKINYERMLQ